ncbi:hypothetical protein TRIUR3_05623 [Triticum urartu]|uniref:Uncharacterized protein n=1 Tax=Triticum urartu TaxID=4572 RepID=M7YRL4_TRIUA|nr:hypothetical protein TRIUR3_05623 [Triticum urartu]
MPADTTVTRSPEKSKTTGGSDDVEEEETQEREAKKMKTNPASVEAAARDDDGDEELEISSPLCEPYIPDELDDPYRYRGISAAYELARAEFSEKEVDERVQPVSFADTAIKLLDPTHAEYIWRKLNIDDGLIVEEASDINQL